MIKICLNTDVLKEYRLREALAMARAAGYRYINLNTIPFWEPHLDFTSPEASERLQELREGLADNGLQLAVVEASTNLSAWDDKEREHAIAYCETAVRMLAPLGCRVLCLSAPGTNLLGIEEQHAILEQSLRRVAAVGRQEGVEVSLEIYPGSCLERTSDAVRLLDRWAIPNLGYTLCIPHVAALGEDILESYHLAGPRVSHVHVADTPSSTVNHKHLVPGQGTVDFLPFFRALVEDRYSRLMTVQIYSCIDDARNAIGQALIEIRRLIAEAGGEPE